MSKVSLQMSMGLMLLGFLSTPVAAHPGHHESSSLWALIMHWMTDPFHLALFFAGGLSIALIARLMMRSKDTPKKERVRNRDRQLRR